MKVRIEFETGNAAFGENEAMPQETLTELQSGPLSVDQLQDIAEAVAYGSEAEFNLRDSNGNTVGTVEVLSDDEPADFTRALTAVLAVAGEEDPDGVLSTAQNEGEAVALTMTALRRAVRS